MYQKVDKNSTFVDREKEVVSFWKENDIFQKSIDSRKEGPTYTFYDGPPTANGKPHIGHVLTRVIKDMIPRYRTMKGYMVPRKAGWDTHGLPVELEVEKLLGINGKEQIEEYGLDPFVRKCKESVWKYKGMWEEFSDTVGFWADMDDPYVTYDDNFIESEWWALKQIWDKGLLYKGFKIVPYCPRCGTPLSSHEVAQGYKTLKERTAVVRFKIKGEDAYFLAWTTTPWTLASNIALCVNPEETYVKVKAADGYTYILAQALADNILGGIEREEGKAAYEVLETYKGKDLEYKEYEPLYQCAADAVEKQHKKAFFVYCDDYVTMSDGTGIVHIAPAFGEDDARVGRKYDAPFVQMVDEHGVMKEETPFAGMRAKPTQKEIDAGAINCDPEVLKELDQRGILFSAPKVEHDYPHCWRCDTPLLYFARESWFIKMTEVRDDLVKNNNTVNWIPQSIGEGRFGNWLENIQDWGISRNRYWGTPLNIWECPDCGERISIGSKAELAEKSGNPDALKVELHRPYIDEITCKCEKCGGTMKRVPEVIDCWFDSGAMPFAQHHYPFENKDLFEKQFPAQFISEAVDQTRGWFYSLMAESTLLFNKAPYENVIVLGLVLDENGQKMSKSKGNSVDPMAALQTLGADAIRWYFYINSAPWLPSRFHDKAVIEGQNKFLGTLWNTYAFYVLYAEIDNFDPTKYSLNYDKLPVMDKWLLSKLNTAVKEVDNNLENYRIPEAAKVLDTFVDEMSNWYVRRSRDRFWAKGMEEDKVNAYMTLYTALSTIAKAAAPMVPFITEEIYQNIVRSVDHNAPESIHLCDFPAVNEAFIDKDLEANMEEVLTMVVLGRAGRNEGGIKNRQPLGNMMVKAERELPEFFQEIVREELNVKKITFTDDVAEFSGYQFKPQLRTVGPKYGKQLGGIKKYLEEVDGNAAMDQLKSEGKISFDVDGTTVELAEEDLLISTKQVEGYVAESDKGVTVVLDKTITEELRKEGYVLEVISKIQTMRKEFDYEVTDHIKVGFDFTEDTKESEELQSAVKEAWDSVATKVLAEGEFSANTLDHADLVKVWDVNGVKVEISVAKA